MRKQPELFRILNTSRTLYFIMYIIYDKGRLIHVPLPAIKLFNTISSLLLICGIELCMILYLSYHIQLSIDTLSSK